MSYFVVNLDLTASSALLFDFCLGVDLDFVFNFDLTALSALLFFLSIAFDLECFLGLSGPSKSPPPA